MSSDKEQEYFSDGLSEELLNLLAQVPQLRVIARTSRFSFKGKDADIAEIAHKLNVAHVLEGSVRKSGDTLRITAQLIRAADSSHLWSQTYDRPMTDVFKVQDEIAAPSSRSSRSSCWEMHRRAGSPIQRPTRCFCARMRCKTSRRWRRSASRLRCTSRGWQCDLGYLEAWRKLAALRINEALNGLRPVDEAYRQAREYIDRALAVDPDFGRGHDGLAVIALYHDLDPAAAAQHWQRALSLDPTNQNILFSTTGPRADARQARPGYQGQRVCRGTRSSQRHEPRISRFPIPGGRPAR